MAYFDQLRDQLDMSSSIVDNVKEGSDFITVAGKEVHVITYLQKFLFPLRKCPIILCHFSPYSRIGYHLCTFQYFNLISVLGQRVVTVNTASLRPPPGGGKPGALTLPTTIKALQVFF